MVSYDFGARNVSLILYCVYEGFIKINMGIVGEFQVCDVVSFYYGFSKLFQYVGDVNT